MHTDLTGKVALVTGGSQGIGRVIALALAEEKCKVYVNCAHSWDNAQKVVNEILDRGGEAEVCICDVADEKAVNAMFAELGKVDILINNARLDPWKRTEEMSEGEWFGFVFYY